MKWLFIAKIKKLINNQSKISIMSMNKLLISKISELINYEND